MFPSLKGIAMRRYNGDTRRGPRYAYLLRALHALGNVPFTDRYGNIWVEKGKGKKIILVSSHFDVDPRVKNMHFRTYNKGNKKFLHGVLDNSVGCYINLLLSSKIPKDLQTIFVFTASEEIEKNNPRKYCRSAREIIKELKRRKISPDLCVALDVTFPRLLCAPQNINWDKDYEKNFDLSDQTHCYVDGYKTRKTKCLAEKLIKKFKGDKVDIRNLTGYDEAFVYRRLAPSFAFGPVVYGHFDHHDQYMPVSHMKTAVKFLKHILRSYAKKK